MAPRLAGGRGWSSIISSCLLVVIVFTVYHHQHEAKKSDEYLTNGYVGAKTGRQLLEFVRENCTRPSIEQFPRPIIGPSVRKHGGVIVHFAVMVYLFIALAVVCDEYFVPALDVICKRLNLNSDVAGATFMAAGSSAPELAAASIGVFIAKDDIGVGTVVGSAVFNITFVIGFCGLFAGQIIYLSWWPMFRDSFFYVISIITLYFSMFDEVVTWYESVILIIIYVCYILFMSKNQVFKTVISPYLDPWLATGTGEKSTLIPGDRRNEQLVNTPSIEADNTLNMNTNTLPIELNSEEDNINSGQTVKNRTLWEKVLLPIRYVSIYTMPDIRQENKEHLFVLTFAISVIWIGFYSYIIVWMITIIGATFNIPDTVMGLTLLAGGASLPDVITSLIVAKQGLGDMAISNAIGSNVFDILICLGFPWFLKTAIISPGSEVAVRSKGLEASTLLLLSTVVFLIAVTWLNKWKLDKKYGIFLLVWYFLFIIVTIMYELNIFGYDSPITCDTNY